MELSFEVVILGSIIAVSVTIGFIAKMYLKPNEYAGKLKKNMNEYIADLEDENKHLKKLINGMKKGPRISEDSLDDPISAITQLIPQFEHLVPKSLKPLLRDPRSIETVAKLIKDNPEAAKNILTKFVSKKGPTKELTDGTSEEEPVSV